LNNNLSFNNLVIEEIKSVENLMRDQAKDHHADLQAALEHLISSGGKRIRPNITLLAGRMLKGNINRLITLSAAIELLHTATLVHDDLIDGSLLRRGIPTLNARWSPAATVLTGDFLFAKAAKLASETDSIPVMKLFANTLVIIVNGEISQLFSSRCNHNIDQYYQRIYEKTASLFETSTLAAGLIAEASEAEKEYLRQFGYEIGIAFQIIDDILDFTSNSEKLGKPVGGDLRHGLITLPAIYYFESHQNESNVKNYIDQDCFLTNTNLDILIEQIRNSDAINTAYEKAKSHVSLGIRALLHLPEGDDRNALEEMANYVTNRSI
jgi:geranylgeranyl pyrophosphate synthase